MEMGCVGIEVVGGRSGESIRLVTLPDALSVDDSSLRSSCCPSTVGYTASKRAFQGRNAVLALTSVTAVNRIPCHPPLFCTTHLPSTHASLLLSQPPAIHFILKPYTAPASSSPPHPSSQAQTQSPTPRPPRLSPPSQSVPR
ncbi:hypothetical protein COCMIDRAFT_31782 [Bipolaris oryzae ATCC 44560]|uniref:Uncharacterized protein n=1 Tax=Bipolaris oryzae ATCC 44560 TaxID=930090 RepID=W6ZLN9_COCMI|nr:uncharacterized protein COCMIDRAFT_31782 [Bipolaris oryzae ATCC 44560]EUC50883.1 hypothetical protein COCMIDRAFT_31782 [Bipolaris oryzae ATCC 44560]